MPNALFSAFGNQTAQPNMMNMVTKFNQFKNSLQGDPKQIVQNLLNTGKMSQEQFNQLSNMANAFSKML